MTNTNTADQPTVFISEGQENKSNESAGDAGTQAPADLGYVGEGKKYSSVADLDQGYANADKHIKELESELAEARTELDSSKRAEEVAETLLSKPKSNDTPVDTLSEDRIEEIAKGAVAHAKQEDIATSNLKQVQDALITKLGDKSKVNEFIANKANELGVDVDYIIQTSMRSAKAALSLLDPTAGNSSDSPTPVPSSDVSSQHKPSGPSPVNDMNKWEYWQNLRRSNFSEYNSASNTSLRHDLVNKGTLVIPT